ncbi:hypothetical protein JYK00_09015 [Thermosipho ferrireducens]|uniref:RNase NYN domain-containing protein n=1 Tax=Thermosipho ferrireducens TaxID=2571116 RepID=A0ABX7S926_9BACT|nr:hypothetical protein [Thermosipho ferrireducens]QTA37848.1 hypothetical protein JYK00_09015 [Thermosipho ferrireducens]
MIYSNAFINRVKELQIKRSVIYEILKNISLFNKNYAKVLQRNMEGPITQKILKVDPTMFSFYVHNLLYGKGKVLDRLLEFNSIGITINEAAEILFWANPKKYPFPKPAYKSFYKFLKEEQKRLIKENLSDFLELYAYDTCSKHEDSLLKSIKEEVKRLSIYEDLSDVEWLRELITYLDPISKEEIRKLTVHPYIKRALFSKPKGPAVLDGSNIIFWSFPPNEANIELVIEKLGTIRDFYFPFYIVFDKNIKYKFNSKYFRHPNTYFHSPADELILSLAKEKKGVIISKDKFKEWNSNIKRLEFKV